MVDKHSQVSNYLRNDGPRCERSWPVLKIEDIFASLVELKYLGLRNQLSGIYGHNLIFLNLPSRNNSSALSCNFLHNSWKNIDVTKVINHFHALFLQVHHI